MGVEDQGISQDRYTVIPRVLIFPFSPEGQVLLLQGAEHKRLWAGHWNGIGGHVEAGESVLQAAKRELQEESGLQASRWTFCGEVMVDTHANPGVAFFIFRAEELAGSLQESAEGHLQWFAPGQLAGEAWVEDLPALLGRVIRFQVGAQPFWGLYQYDAEDQLIMSFGD
jgi:8-oxo-dGTP diphosphatase